MRTPFLVSSLIFVVSIALWAPPTDYPSGLFVDIPEGRGLLEISQELEREGLIHSPLGFRISAILFGGERAMKAGEYYFGARESAITLAWRMLHGNYKVEVVKLTVPEGFSVEEIAELFDDRFPHFNRGEFERTAREGYLFPDTYFVPAVASARQVAGLMNNNFERKIAPILPEIEESGKTLEEIIVMASLIEAEVLNKEDRGKVSDILWKRLKIGMPLQVDSHRPTYESKGLPESPINNPGIVSIESAIHPVATPYLYFLTGNDGKTYYAKNFDEHRDNIARYLR